MNTGFESLYYGATGQNLAQRKLGNTTPLLGMLLSHACTVAQIQTVQLLQYGDCKSEEISGVSG